MFALSPLVGSPLTTSAKFAVVALSPLTGRLCDALSSSHFALAAKRAGLDAPGDRRAPATSRRSLFVDGIGRDDAAVSIGEPAAGVWGLPPAEAEDRFRAETSGPTGRSRRSDRPASGSSPSRRSATTAGTPAGAGSGRCSERSGSRPSPCAGTAARRSPTRPAPSRWPATSRPARSARPPRNTASSVRVANLLVFNRFDALPTRNFQAGHFDGRAERLAAEDLGPARRVARRSLRRHARSAASTSTRRRGRGSTGRPAGIRVALRARAALRGRRPGAVLGRGERCDDARHRHHLDRRNDRLPDGMRRAGLGRRPARRRRDDSARSATAARCSPPSTTWPIVARELGALLAAGQPARGRADRRRRARPRPARQGPGAAGLRPGDACTRWRWASPSGPRGADHNRSGAYEADFSGVPTAATATPARRRRDRDRGPCRPDGLVDPLQVPPRRVRRPRRRSRPRCSPPSPAGT